MSKRWFTKDVFDFNIDQEFNKWGLGIKRKRR